MIEQFLIAALPGLIELLNNATKDTYDQEAERQALLKIQRSIHDTRVRNAIAAAKP